VPGMARSGTARFGRLGRVYLGLARHVRVWQAWSGESRCGEAGRCLVRWGRQGVYWHGKSWSGVFRWGKAGVVRRDGLGRVMAGYGVDLIERNLR